MDVLLTIGEFSKMTYLSVKALRHYHEVGLLERFVAGEPLYRVHECVFGVLALESEPVDPRL